MNPVPVVNKAPGIIKWVVVGFIGIVGVAIAIKMIKKSKKMSSGKDVVENDDIRVAMELNTAIRPARSWVGNIFTSSNKEEIYRIAQGIKNYDEVAKQYQNLYDESLSHELQDALGEDYPAFLTGLKNVSKGFDFFSDDQLKKISDGLFDAMDGLNLTLRDEDIYNQVYGLSDVDFRRTMKIYNGSHSEDFKSMLSNESAWMGPVYNYTFADIKEKLLERYDTLM
jgi:hypothetical protein